MSPKVSIILLSHNRPKYLTEAINSIENQTMRNIELIIIDDASNLPEIWEILSNLKLIIPVIVKRLHKNVNNLAILWNWGIDLAKGEYISFLDDDNRKKPLFCEKMSAVLDKNQDLDGVGCLSEFIDGRGEITGQARYWVKDWKEHIILATNIIDSGELMVRKRFFEQVNYFDETMITCEDWDFVVNLLRDKRFEAIGEKLTQYRSHSTQRIGIKEQLGDRIYQQRVRNKNRIIDLVIISPPFHNKNNDYCSVEDRLTRSQINVVKGFVNNANSRIINFKGHYFSNNIPDVINADAALVIAPFQISMKEMEYLSKKFPYIIDLHMEDPQAIRSNLQRDQFANWVVTNDLSYLKRANGSVGITYFPALLADETLDDNKDYNKDIDVLFCGCQYPSREQFLSSLLKSIDSKYRVCVVGDNRKYLFDNLIILPNLNVKETLNIHKRSKIVVCNHRKNDDYTSDGQLFPESVYRGYMESYCGSLVMTDDSRKYSLFNDSLIFYSSIDDLIKKIRYYLSNKDEYEDIRMRQQLIGKKYTYRFAFQNIMDRIISNRLYNSWEITNV